MKHIGIVAVSAEGAALCYRTVCVEGAALLGPHAHPEVTMHTFPLADYMRPISAGDWDGAAALVLESAEKLRRAGADFLICPDNTAHPAIDRIRHRSPLPWLHIAEEVACAAVDAGHEQLLVLGTKILMEGPVYPTKLRARGIECEILAAPERERIDSIIFDELVYGRFEPAARQFFQRVIAAGKQRRMDAVVLGCTEIPLLVSEADSSLPVLDSTRILARAALRESLATE